MINPYSNITKSGGVDLPILKVYLAGRISGDNINLCLDWRKDIINHYGQYKQDETGNYSAYPIAFIDPLNSGEGDSIDEKGLTSNVPPNLIYDKDLLSVETADVIVCNMDDFMEEGIEELLYDGFVSEYSDYKNNFFILRDKILNRRANIGTICEMSWALYLKKPLILIVPENQKEVYEKHPFTRRASVIVSSTEELLNAKWLQILYKSIAGAVMETPPKEAIGEKFIGG